MPDRRIAMVGFLQAQNCSNFPASWRHPESAGDFMTPEYYRRIARTLEDGKFHLAFFRRSPRDAGSLRRRLHRVGAPRRAGGEDGSDPRPLGDGRGDEPARARRHLLDDVLRTLPRRAPLRDPRPHDRRAGRLERGDLAQRLRGRELRRGRSRRPRRALRPRRRVRGGRARALEGVGAGRHRARQGGAGCSRIRRRCAASTTAAGTSAPAGRSPCLRRGRAIR